MEYGDRRSDPRTESPPSVSRRRILQGTATAGLFSLLSAAEVQADETTEVVVRAAEVDIPLAASTSIVDELKATAQESQDPIVDYVERTDGLTVKSQLWLANALVLEVDASVVDLERLIEQDGITDVHPNFRFEIPNPDVNGVDAETDDVTYGLDQIDASNAWDSFDARGAGSRIAVLDTGVDPDHPDIDLAPENFAEFDGDGEQVDSEPHDSHYHGTHVSGTATGGADSGTAIGVAPDATLLGGLVLPDGGGTFAQIVGGMQWAVEEDADVINMSLGVTGYAGELIEPVRNAERAGTVVVSSSGNSGEGTSGTPGNVYDAFAVGASNEDQAIADFSSGETIATETDWGRLAPDSWPAEYVVPDAAAPGVDVTSAYPIDHADGPYNAISGTSMASPHVAGVVGLIRSAAADATPDGAKRALASTAWKPDGEPADPDTRYGEGIVDAYAAVGRFAADGGVEGTVTDADGNSISGAAITLDGFPVETDRDGRYRIRSVPGTYEVTADAFGYTADTATVDVGDGFTTVDFTLSDSLALAVLDDQPEGLQAGESFTVEFNVANVTSLTVDRVGGYAGDVWLEVDGAEATFGEPVTFDEPRSDEVAVTVRTGEGGAGDLELEHAFGGLGETVTVRTGPTGVYAEPVPIGIVDGGSGFATDLEAMLADGLHPRYQLSQLEPGEAVDAAADRQHEGYVVQNLGDDAELVAEFVAEASAPEVGAVYLDQFGEASDAVSQVADATGDPRDTFDSAVESAAPVSYPVEYEVSEAHPVFEGIAAAGESVTITEPGVVQAGFTLFYSGFHTYFEDYSGGLAGSTVADTSVGFATTGGGLAIDDLSREVYASSLGLGPLVGRTDVTPAGRQLLANLVEHAAATPPISVEGAPAERIAPGESTTLAVGVEDLIELEADLTGLEFIDERDLTLFVDGEEISPGESVAYEEYDGTVEISVETADRVGEFAIATRFVTLGGRDQEIETVATFRPTTVYESPLRVPEQIGDLQAAVDFVRPGDTVTIADGVYEVDAPDRGFQTGLYVGTPDVTIRGETGVKPSIVHARDLPAPRIVHLGADGVTLENVEANVIDGVIDEKNSIGTGVLAGDFTSDVTIRNVTAAGTFGVQLRETSDVTVEDVEAIRTVVGVGTDSGFYGTVDGATIRNVTVTDSPDYSFQGGVVVNGATRVSVTDCHLEHEDGDRASVALFGPFGGGEDCYVANNTIVGPDEEPFSDGWNNGIYVDTVDVTIEDNHIVDAHTGVRVSEWGFGGPAPVVVENNSIENAAVGLAQYGDALAFRGNRVAATVGLDIGPGYFGLDADAILARYNDLSATELPFRGEPADGWGSVEGPFDCRQNYLGERAYGDPIVDGDVAYDPYLTVPPTDLDSIDVGSGAPDWAAVEPTEIATDLVLDAGETYGVGVPGPSDQTIYDVLGADGYLEFAGDIEYWNRDAGRWQRITGEGRLAQLDTLSAFKVTPETGVRAEVHFQRLGDTPPGLRDDSPTKTHLREDGWNFVAAPAYGEAEDVFDTDVVDEIRDEFDAPGGQLGSGAMSPFAGYMVSVAEESWLEAGLAAYDPTMAGLNEGLGLDPAIHENPGPAGAAAGLDITLTDVLESAESGDPDADRVTAFLAARYAEINREGDIDDILSDVSNAAESVVREAPSRHHELVETAADRAAERAARETLGAKIRSESDDGDEAFAGRVPETHSETIESSKTTESGDAAAADD